MSRCPGVWLWIYGCEVTRGIASPAPRGAIYILIGECPDEWMSQCPDVRKLGYVPQRGDNDGGAVRAPEVLMLTRLYTIWIVSGCPSVRMYGCKVMRRSDDGRAVRPLSEPRKVLTRYCQHDPGHFTGREPCIARRTHYTNWRVSWCTDVPVSGCTDVRLRA